MLEIIKKVKYDDDNNINRYGRNDVTQNAIGVLPLDMVSDIKPSGHEKREWKILNEKEYFGLYPKDDWGNFLKDIKKNGVKEHIMIFVEKDGRIEIGEGNHRIQACLQTGAKEIPVDIRYFGGAETYVDYFDNYIEKP